MNKVPISQNDGKALTLESFETFKENSLVQSLAFEYEKRKIVAANCAVKKLIWDLEQINKDYKIKHNRVLFTTIEGRVKSKESFLHKVYNLCKAKCKEEGLSSNTLQGVINSIVDVAGVRFACPYYDEVKTSIENEIRPLLTEKSYATDLSSQGLDDVDHLDNGDDHGYRSYHFYMKIPTVINIYNETELIICEVQGRSELQHVWAVKSHDLVYKKEGIIKDFVEDLRQISHNLRNADHYLVKVRKSIRGK